MLTWLKGYRRELLAGDLGAGDSSEIRSIKAVGTGQGIGNQRGSDQGCGDN